MAGHPLLASPPAILDGHGVSFREATRVWARVALLSFGGPAGQIAVMHRILVDEKHWIGETRFLHALNYCMFLPGPEAHQLAIYIGWLLHRVRGGIVAGTLFVLPGVISLGVLSWLYAETTPGPLISVVQFVGFIAAFRHPGALPPAVAGTLGGLLAAWTTFVPSFMWIFVGAPYIESVRNNKALGAALAAITAAVVGVILNLAIWFFRFKVGMIPTLMGCSIAGILFHVAGFV